MTRLARTLLFSLYELKLMLGACAQLQSDNGGENVVQLLWWVRIVATFKIFREVAPKCQMSSRELSQSALKLDGNLWQTRNGKVAYDALQQHYITHNVANVGKIVKTEINQE